MHLCKDPGGGGGPGGGGNNLPPNLPPNLPHNAQRVLPTPAGPPGYPLHSPHNNNVVNVSRSRDSTASSFFENCYAEIPSEASFRVADMKSLEYLHKGSPPDRGYPPRAITNGSPDSGVGDISKTNSRMSVGGSRTPAIKEVDLFENHKLKRQNRKYIVLHVVVMALAGIAYIGIGVLAGYFIGKQDCAGCDYSKLWPTAPPPPVVLENTTIAEDNHTMEMVTTVEEVTTTTTEPPTTTLPPVPSYCQTVNGLCECGPFGGDGGSALSDADIYKNNGNITKFTIRYNDYFIVGLQLWYGSQPGVEYGSADSRYTNSLTLDTGEVIQSVEVDFTEGKSFLTRLVIQTSVHRLGPYGGESGHNFVSSGGKLLYISGRAGLMIDQLTFYYDRC